MTEELKPCYNAQGLVPVIVQDAKSKAVLMLAWMNKEAYNLTLQTRMVHFWSRSRKELWLKGATSGNYLHLIEMYIDCDEDALLVFVNADGPACHTGKTSCFFRNVPFESDFTRSN